MLRQRLTESQNMRRAEKGKQQRKPAGACITLPVSCAVATPCVAVHVCVGTLLCIHLPATNSRLWSELVPGTASPGRNTALPQQPGSAVDFSLVATQSEYHEIRPPQKMGCNVPWHARGWGGRAHLMCTLGPCQKQIESSTPYGYFPKCRGSLSLEENM